MHATKKKVSDLEKALTNFVNQTNYTIGNLAYEMERFKDEMKRSQKDMNKKWGELANKMGTIIEDIVAPNIPRIATDYFEIKDIQRIMVNIKMKYPQSREFDVIVVSENKVILNETKSTPRISYIEDFIDFLKTDQFFTYFPEFKGRKIIPVFSSLHLDESVVAFLSKNKIFALAMKDDTMDILNPEILQN